MPTANYAVGEDFPIQFAWHLPDGDYVRAVFTAVVFDHIPEADKYLVQLKDLIAGRQEDADGNLRPTADFSREYWTLVGKLIGRKVTVAYEVDDSRALHMRLETLTGEHNFFTRYEDAEVIAKGLLAAQRRARREEQGEGEEE